MGVSPARIIRFVRWLASSEDLEASPDPADDGPSPAAAPRTGFLRRVMARETLPETPDETPEPAAGVAAGVAQKGLFSWLLGREPLPEEPPPTTVTHSTRGLSWLLAREPLPEEPPDDVGSKRLRLLRFFVTPEQLPLDPPAAAGAPRGGVTLRWLLGRDRLGDDAGTSPYSGPANGPETGPHNSPGNDAPIARDSDPTNDAHTGGSGSAS